MNKENKIDKLSVAISQLSPIVGALSHNFDLAFKACQKAEKQGADILIFSELFLSGYPPEDLILKPYFLLSCQKYLNLLIEKTKNLNLAFLIGVPYLENEKCYNAACFINKGQILALHYKNFLPNYSEFDEKRIFEPGKNFYPFFYKGITFGVAICEDIWQASDLDKNLKKYNCEMLFVLNGSPYTRLKNKKRENICSKLALLCQIPVFYINQVGGQDSLVFDGLSFVMGPEGKIIDQLPNFEECFHISQIFYNKTKKIWKIQPSKTFKVSSGLESDYRALSLALKDYVHKNGFKEIIIGLSGGIDSALCLALAVDSLGAENVNAFMLASKYTSQSSLEDAKECAIRLGCSYDILKINNSFLSFLEELNSIFGNMKPDTTEENLQSRIRGVYLMALSNKFNKLLLTTGNKSEIATGYATIYGDMNGSYNPIKDLYKTEVYSLSRWRNAHCHKSFKNQKLNVIPENILSKAPSAELKENQTDQDSLPPYEILDKILYHLLEKERSVFEICSMGFKKEVVLHIENLLYKNEYKRYQAAPGAKISEKSFNRDRRYPITNHFFDMGESLDKKK